MSTISKASYIARQNGKLENIAYTDETHSKHRLLEQHNIISRRIRRVDPGALKGIAYIRAATRTSHIVHRADVLSLRVLAHLALQSSLQCGTSCAGRSAPKASP